METQNRHRPNLPPVWVGPDDEHPHHPIGPYAARSNPLCSPMFRTDGLPSAMYPSSGYDRSMRQHERAMVDSLDLRGRQFESKHSPIMAQSLSPIVEPGLDPRRASIISLPPPHAPASSPETPSFMLQYSRRQTLAAETRSILLSGIPDGLPRVTVTVDERRPSLPLPPEAPRRNSQAVRKELQAWGHVFLLNGSEAQCFVSAVALRRASESFSPADESCQRGEEKKKPLEQGNHLTVRVRVRPCALDRKPFLLTRTFDMDLLRATIPEPEPVFETPRRLSVDWNNRRGSLATSNHRPSVPFPSRGERSARLDGTHLRSTNTVPIHRPYACAFFPVLAALLYSKHLQPRDIIDLPLPHPEVWGQTVAHVYTGQGQLTEAIKRNILYLGGKV